MKLCEEKLSLAQLCKKAKDHESITKVAIKGNVETENDENTKETAKKEAIQIQAFFKVCELENYHAYYYENPDPNVCIEVAFSLNETNLAIHKKSDNIE